MEVYAVTQGKYKVLNYTNVHHLTLGKVIELRPTSYHSWPAFRVELYGVTQGKYKVLNYNVYIVF